MITVYSKQGCRKCDDVKGYLESKGHFFMARDITNDLILLTKFRTENPGKGFPVADFDGEVIAGDVEAIKAKADTLN